MSLLFCAREHRQHTGHAPSAGMRFNMTEYRAAVTGPICHIYLQLCHQAIVDQSINRMAFKAIDQPYCYPIGLVNPVLIDLVFGVVSEWILGVIGFYAVVGL
jgi:hypothetical protein